MNVIHVPNGDMCIGCTHALRKCNHLNFPSMQVMNKKDKQYPIVKCTDYKRPSTSKPYV